LSVLARAFALLASLSAIPLACAQDSLCARVKIEIKQELTLEHQAFDAQMTIANGLDTTALENVSIVVNFADDAGNAVRATSDTNDATALFFIRVDSLRGIDRVDGSGRVAPATTAEIHWLIIPAPGAGGATSAGKLYLVGATLGYKLAGEPQTVAVTPDSIYVKPLPKLALDYFLQTEVYADDPFTAAIESAEPFTLGVRVKNSGYAAARNLKIESAQPRIVDNKQGLLVNFRINGSFVNDQPSQPSLLIDFGEIASQKASTGRWLMQSTLSGKFVEFNASFVHADELGGAVTSLIQEPINTHALVKDVRVDLPGRDAVRDFLAKDADTYRVYETDAGDTAVTDQSAAAMLTAATGSGDEINVGLTAPATAGFFYVKLPDPYRGAKTVARALRSDGKRMPAENVWFSKTLKAGGQWDYFVNLFDVNTSGRYTLALATPADGPRPPVLQFVPDRITKEGEQVSFIVEASDPDQTTPRLSASPLPAGARFVDQGNGVAVFEWTPTLGQAGRYAIAYSASDGALETTQLAAITVQPAQRPAGPDIPAVLAPTLDARVQVLRPILMVSSANALDSATRFAFELYADAGLTTLLATGEAARGADATTFKVPIDLIDNARYWWRVRAFDGATYSEWANGRFMLDLANDAPAPPQPSAPRDGAEVDTLTPVLAAVGSLDADGDAVQMSFELFADADGAQPIAASGPLPVGVTAWTVPDPLTATRYYWRITATDVWGAITESPMLRFTVNPANNAPAAPAIVRPALGATLPPGSVQIEVSATDPDGDALTYQFELDREAGFNSPVRRRLSGSATLAVAGLPDNTRWYWRARASDGKADGSWVTGSFVVSASDDAPGTPVLRNLGPDSWTEAPRPRFEVAPSVDPEGDAITYEFQLFGDAALSSLIAEGSASQPTWLCPTSLADRARYFWRARAADAAGNPSAWSPAAAFVVDTDVRTAPRLAFASPERILLAGSSGRIAWEARDAENNARLSLYADRDGSGADGQEIARDLPLDPSIPEGSFNWNLTALSPGAYHVYGVLTNGQRTTVSYAPGVFVVPSPTPRGSVVLKATSSRALSEVGTEGTMQVTLSSAPSADVIVSLNTTRPSEGRVEPGQLLFTPANWNKPQEVKVRALNDCLLDGTQTFQAATARAVSGDVDYAGVTGNMLSYTNIDNDTATTVGTLATCGFKLVSTRVRSITVSEYTMTVDLTNLGDDLRGVQATLTSSSPNSTIVDGSVTFGSIARGETATSLDTFVLRQDRRFTIDFSKFLWTLTPIP
jgi:hypothetical protein